MLDPLRLIPKLLDWCLVFFNMDLCMWLLKTQVAEEPLTAIFFPFSHLEPLASQKQSGV